MHLEEADESEELIGFKNKKAEIKRAFYELFAMEKRYSEIVKNIVSKYLIQNYSIRKHLVYSINMELNQKNFYCSKQAILVTFSIYMYNIRKKFRRKSFS